MTGSRAPRAGGSVPRVRRRTAVETRPAPSATWKRYNAYLRTPPEITLSWHDPVTGARAWLVINSSRNGAAGGGTRMHASLEPREVIYLAKAMELKFAISGPPIGGAKCGIAFDPRAPDKADVLERWYRSIWPFLHDRFGTGGDLNIDEVRDVIPAFERIGLAHPQEGIVRGHVQPRRELFRRIIQRLDRGVEAEVDGEHGLDGTRLTVADIVTGYGLAIAVQRLYERQGRDLADARVSIEGFGNVGAACALYLTRAGARVVAARDARSMLIAPDGLSASDVEDLLPDCAGKALPREDARVHAAEHAAFLDRPADVFVCAAISGSLGREQLERLDAAGVRVIACGANQPFREAKMGSTRPACASSRVARTNPFGKRRWVRRASRRTRTGASPCLPTSSRTAGWRARSAT